jgi:hypothetical protein
LTQTPGNGSFFAGRGVSSRARLLYIKSEATLPALRGVL